MAHIYADFIDKVAKPSRYLGGEYLSVTKPADAVDARIVMCFPDVYEIGMSHLGTKILYSHLNKHDRLACERAFTPWVDMEAELRARDLPLVSLESSTPLVDFDVVGISLQYELTFSNALTLLDLGGVPLRTDARSLQDPLVIGGGPTSTHPEPMAPFFDAFFIGEAEHLLAELVLDWRRFRDETGDRRESLVRLAQKYPIYVPSLYHTETDAATGMTVVGAPLDSRVPARVQRGMVKDLNDYPFPSDAPVPFAEAVFDRAAIEIARGCTEGCRFCQAGMIYRPVRERSPESIVNTVVDSVEKAGYDETSLTSLSTADYSCVTPLVKSVMKKLRPRDVSLSVSSLRAYGLNDDILDEIASMRVTGLTFAPEAGTQRMRDVVNKNVTEQHITDSSHRVFERGWHRLKLYFMIGLPTEQDNDVCGIVETGERMLKIGLGKVGRKAQVTVSVSTHVPKPHTPFQWCAQDVPAEVKRKQAMLRDTVSMRSLKLKYHNGAISHLEGILARGDRRLADGIELAWRRGARFDGWDELFEPSRWHEAFAETAVDTASYLETRPISARLPWDHIDVGLEDGFLLQEYRKAVRDRLSPPCGKVAGEIIHPANLDAAKAQTKKLVCYDCGVACDLTQMRAERIAGHESLVALGGGSHVGDDTSVSVVAAGPSALRRRNDPRDTTSTRFRIRYTKTGRAAFLGHLDTARMLARMFRRAGVEVAYSEGFHPKPKLEFGPALALGVPSLGEYVDVLVRGRWTAPSLHERLQQVASEGNDIIGVWQLGASEKSLGKLIRSYELAVCPPAGRSAADCLAALDSTELLVERKRKTLNIRPLIATARRLEAEAAERVRTIFEWPSEAELVVCQVQWTPDGSAKPREVAQVLTGNGESATARLGFADLASSADIASAPKMATL